MAKSKRYQLKEGFDLALNQLEEENPLFTADYDPLKPARNESVIRAFTALGKWLADVDLRLQRLHDDTLVKGWDDIAYILGENKRNLMRKKLVLMRNGVIDKVKIGDSDQERIVATPSALIRYRLRKRRKT